jgi:hypothetical protein
MPTAIALAYEDTDSLFYTDFDERQSIDIETIRAPDFSSIPGKLISWFGIDQIYSRGMRRKSHRKLPKSSKSVNIVPARRDFAISMPITSESKRADKLKLKSDRKNEKIRQQFSKKNSTKWMANRRNKH